MTFVSPPGAIAAIFISGRTGADAAGYGAAAAMEAAATRRDGFPGMDSARDGIGVGITISWCRDKAAAIASRHDS